jgi:hypothetical protein
MSAEEEGLEPLRLRADPNEPLSFREELVREQAFRVDYDDVKGLERFRASVQPTKASAGAPRKWTSSALGAIGVAVLIAGASVGLTWRGTDDTAGAPVVTAPATAKQEISQQPASPVVPTLTVESLPPAMPLPTSAASPPPPIARSARSSGTTPQNPPPASSASSVVDPLEETRHLGALRRIAASDPETALSVVADGNRRFAGGSFREERDAIAIDALARLGREAEARRAAATFLTTYPTSPLAPSVRRAAGL